MNCDPVGGFCSRVGAIVTLISTSGIGSWIPLGVPVYLEEHAVLQEAQFRNTLFLNAITYRIIFGSREETVVKSGKCVSPVLEMLLRS